MWQNLSDETRQKIASAGMPPTITFLDDLQSAPNHQELFATYFQDNCDTEQDRRHWECYWWLSPHSYELKTRSRSTADMRTRFEETYGPNGGLAIEWSSDITSWFAQRDQMEAERAALWNPKWDDIEDPKGAEWNQYSEANDRLYRFEQDNPYPWALILDEHVTRLRNWYKAYSDEVARMMDTPMPAYELDRGYIDSINKVNLDKLAVEEQVPYLGFGYYVLIGEHSSGYQKAVTSYDHSWSGTVTMKARGGAFSPGKVEVTGCSGDDQKWFKEAFRRVSKKAIDFA